MKAKEIKKIDKEAIKAYEKEGLQGVINVANKYGINEYKNCPSCDCDVPVLDECCLVCGTYLE